MPERFLLKYTDHVMVFISIILCLWIIIRSVPEVSYQHLENDLLHASDQKQVDGNVCINEGDCLSVDCYFWLCCDLKAQAASAKSFTL